MRDLLPFARIMESIYADDSNPTWQNATKTAHIFLRKLNGVNVIAHEGTTDFQEWLVDFMCLEVPLFDHPKLGPVHAAYAADLVPLIDPIAQVIGSDPYISIGHSKGGGEDLEFIAEMLDRGHPPLFSVAFEAPRVGTSIMRDFLASVEIIQTCTQNTHGKDIITQVPYGPTYVDMREPILLTVPDSFNIAEKHKIQGVLAGLGAS